MPFFRDPNLDKQDDQTGGVQVSSGGQQAGPDGSTSGGGSQQGAQKSAQTGSGFTNIDNYLKNNNAQAFGQEFGGKIQGDIDQSKANMDQTAGQVKSQINSTGYTPSQEEINGAISKAGYGTTADDAKAYQDWTTQSYGGPNSLADNQSAWGQYWGQANKAQTEANESGKESGRFALLDQYYGRPNYSFGDKSLDNLLIQGGGGFNNAKDLQDQAAGLSSYGTAQSQDIANTAAQRAAAIDQSKQAARSAIGLQADGTISGGAIGDLESGIDARTVKANQDAQSNYNNLYSDLGDNSIRGDTAETTGLRSGQDLYNLNLQKYLTPAAQATRQNVASDADYARYLALSQLAGVDPTYLTPDQRTKAGSQAAGPGFNSAAFQNDLSATKSDYDSQLAALKQGFNQTPYDVNDSKNVLIERQKEIDALGQRFGVGNTLQVTGENATGVRPDPVGVPNPAGIDPVVPGAAVPPAAAAPTTGEGSNVVNPTYAYAGHEWDDPDLASMFDPDTHQLRAR